MMGRSLGFWGLDMDKTFATTVVEKNADTRASKELYFNS